MITKVIDGVSFELKEDFDFAFISEYGQVFAVFDKQDSGNLCFGVQSQSKKLFLKVAGAATTESSTSGDEAISRLQSTIEVYEELRHPKLIGMVEHKEIKGGYLAVFDWFEGECMGKQYQSFHKFMALRPEEKLDIYNEILLFHIHANARGYIAIDFYDGCIMYNFRTKQTMICDIEFYQKKPVINAMGRMWGSSRYMSPEEFQLGAEIDEQSNVFVMGATAFQLFGGGLDRSFEQWNGTERHYAIALKAVNADKSERYPTIKDYYEAWMKESHQ